MRTKRIIAKCEQHSGYGAGAGDTEYYEYECPCGKGSYEKSASSDDYALNLAALQDATLYDGLYAFFSDFVPTANGITILAVEEPESHLHPIYQRLLYRHIMNKTIKALLIRSISI